MEQKDNEKVNFLPHQAEVRAAVLKVLAQIGCEIKKDRKGRDTFMYGEVEYGTIFGNEFFSIIDPVIMTVEANSRDYQYIVEAINIANQMPGPNFIISAGYPNNMCIVQLRREMAFVPGTEIPEWFMRNILNSFHYALDQFGRIVGCIYSREEGEESQVNI